MRTNAAHCFGLDRHMVVHNMPLLLTRFTGLVRQVVRKTVHSDLLGYQLVTGCDLRRRLSTDADQVAVDSRFMALLEYRKNAKVKKVIDMLQSYDYTEKQVNTILEQIGKYIAEEPRLNEQSIKECIDCWTTSLQKPKLRPNQLDKYVPEDIDYDLTVDFQTVSGQIEPKLLMMTTSAIKKRIDDLWELGIIGGAKDLWRVVVYAPMGFYLQDWREFMKKFHYLTFVVLEWLLDKKQKDALYPHPIIRNAKVMELPFEDIKTRFVFAKRTGLKSISVVNTLRDVNQMNRIDLRCLMLTSLNEYLKVVAPRCTEEEYNVLSKMVSEEEEDEEEIIDELIELNDLSHEKSIRLGKELREVKKLEEKTEYQYLTPN